MFGPKSRFQKDKKGFEIYKKVSARPELRDLAEEITTTQENPKLAALAEAFEKMQEQPLAKRFQRNKIHLYLDKKQQRPEETFKERLVRESAGDLAARMKLIHLSENYIQILNSEELEMVIAHEMGHVLRGDPHPRKGHLASADRRAAEFMADEIAILLCGKAEVLKSAIIKLFEHERGVIDKFTPESPAQERFKQRLQKTLDPSKDNKAHPNLNDRIQHIEEFAKRISTPEGRVAAEDEVVKKLEAEHRNLFKHQYDRDIPPTR